MSDLEEFYQYASECAEALQEALEAIPSHEKVVSRARRCLVRAQTAYGEPAVLHERRVRVSREAIEALDQALVNFETNAPLAETLLGVRKAHRRLRKVQLANL